MILPEYKWTYFKKANKFALKITVVFFEDLISVDLGIQPFEILDREPAGIGAPTGNTANIEQMGGCDIIRKDIPGLSPAAQGKGRVERVVGPTDSTLCSRRVHTDPACRQVGGEILDGLLFICIDTDRMPPSA